MDEETKNKIGSLINSLYDNGYIDNNNFLNSKIDWTREGKIFMKEKWSDLWSVSWPNFSHPTKIWLPRTSAKNRLNDAREHSFNGCSRDYWEYVPYNYWNSGDGEQRLDLLIEVLDLGLNDFDYIELDDLVL